MSGLGVGPGCNSPAYTTILRLAGSGEKIGDHHERLVECPAAWPQRMGVPGGRAVPVERLQSEDGLAGKSFAGPLEKIYDSTNRSGSSDRRRIVNRLHFLGA